MNYKWCVCDMDGTLLNSAGLISPENEKVLKNLQDRGVKVIIASGRTDLAMKPYIKQLNLKEDIICCNGALVKHVARDEIVYSKPIEKNTANMILRYCVDNKLDFMAYTEEFIYSNANNRRAIEFLEINKVLPPDLQIPIHFLDYNEMGQLDTVTIIKFLLVEDDDKKLKYYQNYFSQIKGLSAVISAEGLLDVWADGVSKGSALKALAEKLNIDLNEVVAFGDNYNDIEMLKTVGMPIAMGNAVDEIKQLAKHITKSNDEDGIAYAWSNLLR